MFTKQPDPQPASPPAAAPSAPEATPQAAPLEASPAAGGSYLRDPVTGVLTLDIPPTAQE